ncbi:MAG TPA: helix-turn-helix domain-containing protein [Dehalococcoidia bacterium]|nr:helix-turn-helix domain-containing protein [Dehalococcoidia bacterium]
MTFEDVSRRVAGTLLKLGSLKSPNQTEPIRLNESELTASVGTSREMISRCLSSLQRRGIIEFSRGQLRVLLPQALKAATPNGN